MSFGARRNGRLAVEATGALARLGVLVRTSREGARDVPVA